MEDFKTFPFFFVLMVRIIGSELGKLIPDHHNGVL